MHRNHLLDQLARYQPLDARDDAQRREVAAFVREHPDCFARTCLPGHLTASAWLLDAGGRRVLLTHHRKLGRWIQLGGHLDGESDLLAAALREAREESGIHAITALSPEIFDLDIHAYPAVGHEPAHRHYDIRFLLQVQGRDEVVVSDESHALAWFSPEEVDRLKVDEAVKRMNQKWRRWMQPQRQ